MAGSGLITADNFLLKSAISHLSDLYEQPSIKIDEQIDPDLGWRPSVHFKAKEHLIIAAEVSETPYPQILRIRHADICNIQVPIAVYCVCPEDVYLQVSKRSEVRELKNHGFGLITVGNNGLVTILHKCIPLIQHLPDSEFKASITELPKNIKILLKEAYESYIQNAGNGVKELTEIVEALVLDAGKKAARKGFISRSEAKGNCAKILDSMTASRQCSNAVAAIGGVRSYYSEYRNTSHHIPRDKRQAYRKYRDCLHAFREGIRKICSFRIAMKNIGINIKG